MTMSEEGPDERVERSIERRLERVESALRVLCRKLGMDELTIRREARDIDRLEAEVEHTRYPRTVQVTVAAAK